MRLTIAPGVIYLDRAGWGANPAIVGGHLMNGAAEKIEVPIHHTVIIDNDATPDLWETEAEVKLKMRQLQVIRADITDVPYNAVIFLMANGDIIVCEGRGPNRSGAHTIDHNRGGYGVAFEGNMEVLPNPQVELYVPKINFFFGWVKAEQLPRLGDFVTGHEHSAWQFFPHREVSKTLCPGQAVMAVINQFRYELAEEEDMAQLHPFVAQEEEGGAEGVWLVFGDLSGRYRITHWNRVGQYRWLIAARGGNGDLIPLPKNFLEPIPIAGVAPARNVLPLALSGTFEATTS